MNREEALRRLPGAEARLERRRDQLIGMLFLTILLVTFAWWALIAEFLIWIAS